eukprot:1997305-Prymnesium_polylepis.2
MNPLVDTGAESALFKNKSSVYELMHGEYMRTLKLRSISSVAEGTPPPQAGQGLAITAPVPAAAAGSATVLVPAPGRAASDELPTQPKKKPKMALSVLGGLAKFKLTAAANTTAVDDAIAAEIAKFESIKVALSAAPNKKYISSGIFQPVAFWNDHMKVLPIHAKVYRGDTGPMKGASANVESIFSGVKRLLGEFAATMSPEILEMYVFIHYNMQYDFMRPTVDEIVEAYKKIYGSEPMPEDVVSDEEGDDEESESESDEEEEEAEE